MSENKLVAVGDCAGASGYSSLQSDAEVARILQEEEDSHTAQQVEQLGSLALHIAPVRRKKREDQRFVKTQADSATHNETPKSTEAAQIQEQEDLALALKLAQEDIERTGRDYLLEVDKLAFHAGGDTQHGQEPRRGNLNRRRVLRSHSDRGARYQRDLLDDIDVGGVEHVQQGSVPVIDLTNGADDGEVWEEEAALPWPVRLEGFNHRVHAEFLPDNDEFSENDYEALLSLGDRLGEVKQRGLDKNKIHEIPTRTFTKQSRNNDDSSKTRISSDAADCKICLTVFDHGDELRHLPCGHEYHQKCIDQWVQRNAVCPVCRRDLKP